MRFPKACLFDLDGVLLDTEPHHEQAWEESANSFGIKVSKNKLISLKGRTRIDCALEIIKLSRKEIKLKDFLDVHNQSIIRNLKDIKPIDGAKELINWCLDNKLPIALVTSSSSESFKRKSISHKWLDVFNVQVRGDDPLLKKGKPSPYPYLLAAKKLNVSPKRCWVVEDSNAGVKSGLKAGCKVWVLNNESEYSLYKDLAVDSKEIIFISCLKEVLVELKKNRAQGVQ